MSIKGRLGSAVMRRIERMPAVREAAAREERLGPVRRAAMAAASSTADEETARDRLRARLAAPEEVVREATIELSKHRDDHVHDRAYRLLSAAAAGGPVQPVPPERAELFERERALASVPMKDAYAQLASIEPALGRVEQTVRAGGHREDADDRSALGKPVEEQLRGLVGGGATSEDELMRTTLAGSLARQYLWILSGANQFGAPEDTFYEAPLKSFVATTVLGRAPNDRA
jgi:hypothetical protein